MVVNISIPFNFQRQNLHIQRWKYGNKLEYSSSEQINWKQQFIISGVLEKNHLKVILDLITFAISSICLLTPFISNSGYSHLYFSLFEINLPLQSIMLHLPIVLFDHPFYLKIASIYFHNHIH